MAPDYDSLTSRFRNKFNLLQKPELPIPICLAIRMGRATAPSQCRVFPIESAAVRDALALPAFQPEIRDCRGITITSINLTTPVYKTSSFSLDPTRSLAQDTE